MNKVIALLFLLLPLSAFAGETEGCLTAELFPKTVVQCPAGESSPGMVTIIDVSERTNTVCSVEKGQAPLCVTIKDGVK